MNNISIIDDKNCTGCGVCSIKCPKNAIDIKLNERGFFVAMPNDTCIDCGMCKTVCYKFFNEHSNHDESFNIDRFKAYLSYSNDNDIRYKSSSGGIGTEIAKYGIKNNYLICGVKYNYDLNRAEHMITDNFKDINLIMGSKYIPSYTMESFKNLRKDKKYIVFGTPCQIYGLRKYMISNDLNNMILVDFFCHGVPSYNLWKKYLIYISKKFKIDKTEQINFRNKTFGWHNFSMKIEGNNRKYINRLNKDIFLRLFLSNFCLDKSCYNCKLRFNKVYSDIRLGDFWGPMCKNDEIGSSMVLANSKIGHKVLNDLKGNVYLKKITFEDLKISQYVLKIDKPQKYDEFNSQICSDISLDKLYYKYLFKYDVKIVIKKIISKILPKKFKKYIKSKIA